MSGRKNVIVPVVTTSAVDISVNYTGTVANKGVTNIQFLDRVSIQVVFTGTPSGEFFLDSSVDGKAWVPLDIDQMAVTAADTLMIDIHDTAMPWMRQRWVAAGGSGTMTVTISAKEV